MQDPAEPGAMHPTDDHSNPYERHRLASSAGGTGGSSGNTPEEMLATLHAAAAALMRRSVEGRTPEEVRAWVQQAGQVRRQIVELTEAYERALLEEAAGRVVARRIERMARPHARRLERERRRAQGGLYAGEKRSPNRPTQVEVDLAAWTVLKAHEIRSRKPLAAVVGRLLVQSFDRSLESLVQATFESRPTAQDAAPRPRPERRFAWLFIDDADWLRFRERATQLGLSVARLVGIVAEDEARALGWRP